jgi:heme O synthase-like polyprenyltransferase
MFDAPAIEHGSSRSSRWLRDRKLRITFWVAAIQGLLYLVHVLHWWEAVVLALIAIGFWWFAGRDNRSDTVRQASWIFAASQLIVLCVPLALAVVKAIAVGVVALLAIGALVLLFTRRP